MFWICEFCYIFTENAQKESDLCIGCSSRVEILCPVLFGISDTEI